MKRLAALEALGRGISNVRGNFEVVGVAAAGTILLLGVVVLTLVPWLGASQDGVGGLFRLAMGQGRVADLPSLFVSSWTLVKDSWGLVLALAFGLTVASVVYCWYYGGILGVLYAGDAQAPPGPRRGAELFRTWSPRLFAAESTRLVWRVLGFFTLWLTAFAGVLCLLVFVPLVAAGVGGSSGVAAGVALGCGMALPLLFVFFALLGASCFGQVELVPPQSGVKEASRAGLRLLGRRLPATVALLVLLFVAAGALGAVDAGIGWAVGEALAGAPAAAMAAQVALFVAQALLSALLNLVMVAAFVALARSEQRLAADAAA